MLTGRSADLCILGSSALFNRNWKIIINLLDDTFQYAFTSFLFTFSSDETERSSAQICSDLGKSTDAIEAVMPSKRSSGELNTLKRKRSSVGLLQLVPLFRN